MKRKMKRSLTAGFVLLLSIFLVGCFPEETVEEDDNLAILNPIEGSCLEKKHSIEGFDFITTYDTGDYDLSRWRITDSKIVNMSAKVQNVPEGATVLVEHVHIDISLKSTNPQLDGLAQDSMDDSWHGVSQDGFIISEKYAYNNKFAIEGFSKDLIEGWGFVCGEYGSVTCSQTRLTEKNLVEYGDVYGNKMQVIYDIIIKYEGEEYYHVVSVKDEFLIPVHEEKQVNDFSEEPVEDVE